MKTYLEFINEVVNFDKLKKNINFLEDLNNCAKEISKENGQFSSFWDVMKKYPDILKREEIRKAGDFEANLHNKNKIPKKITITQSLYLWMKEIDEIEKKLGTIENFTDWFFNKEIELYRGFPSSKYYTKSGIWKSHDEKETRESLIESESEYKSFSMKLDTAINFTQSDWVDKGWKNDKERNGWIVKTKIKPCDVHMFNNAGHEFECILKHPVKYIGYLKIIEAKVTKDINY